MSQETTCLCCRGPLREIDGSFSGMHFRGPMLLCDICGMPFFRRGVNYLDEQNRISDADPSIRARVDDLIESPGKVRVEKDLDRELLAVAPSRDDALGREVLRLHIGADRLSLKTGYFVMDLARICCAGLSYRKEILLDIGFGGYADDDRPIWLIPEVGRFCFEVWKGNTAVALFLTDQAFVPFALTTCIALPGFYFGTLEEQARTPERDMAEVRFDNFWLTGARDAASCVMFEPSEFLEWSGQLLERRAATIVGIKDTLRSLKQHFAP